MSAPVLTDDLAGSAASLDSSYAAGPLSQSRLVRQEVALGLVRELVPPQNLIGLRYAPFKDVPADDVVFFFAKGASTGLAPARADDAEAELFQQDEFAPGEGRARLIDWALKTRYSPSDVNTHRSLLRAAEQLREGTVPLYITSVTEEFNAKVFRDTAQRRARLDNRINWLIMQSLTEGNIVYNDGRIKFSIDWGRPPGQHRQAPASGVYTADTHDPIGDIKAVQTFMRKTYGVQIREALCSQDYLDTFWASSKFRTMAGFTTGITNSDLPYLIDGWGPDSAVAIVERATGVKFTVVDDVYRTRVVGTQTFVNNRWFPRTDVLFLPGDAEIRAYDDTDIGFGRTLTSPHPAGNWTSGFYEWETDYGKDPWGYAVGTGIKALPVFPHMDLTYSLTVTLPA